MSGSQPVHKHSRTFSDIRFGYPGDVSYIYTVNDEVMKKVIENIVEMVFIGAIGAFALIGYLVVLEQLGI